MLSIDMSDILNARFLGAPRGGHGGANSGGGAEGRRGGRGVGGGGHTSKPVLMRILLVSSLGIRSGSDARAPAKGTLAQNWVLAVGVGAVYVDATDEDGT